MRASTALLAAVALGTGLLLLRKQPAPLSAAVARKLAGYPAAARYRFTDLLAAFEAAGYLVEITSTYRAGNQNSQHSKWRAIDLNVVHRATGRRYRSTTPKAEWEATGLPQLAVRRGFRWGGNFRSTPYDPVHFDLGLPTSFALAA